MGVVKVQTAIGGHVEVNSLNHAVAHVRQPHTFFIDNFFDHLVVRLS